MKNVEIHGITGTHVLSAVPEDGHYYKTDVAKWPSGMYLVTVTLEDSVQKHKFIKP